MTKRTEFAQWLAQQPDRDKAAPPSLPTPAQRLAQLRREIAAHLAEDEELDAGQKDRIAALREMRELGHGS